MSLSSWVRAVFSHFPQKSFFHWQWSSNFDFRFDRKRQISTNKELVRLSSFKRYVNLFFCRQNELLNLYSQIVELVELNENELSSEIFNAMKTVFRSLNNRVQNRKETLNQFQKIQKKNFEFSKFLKIAISEFKVNDFSFWTDDISTKSQKIFANILSSIYYNLEQEIVMSNIHLVFYSLTIYELCQLLMTMFENNHCINHITEIFAILVLNEKYNNEKKEKIRSNIVCEFKKSVTLLLYVKELDHDCFFYLFNIISLYM